MKTIEHTNLLEKERNALLEAARTLKASLPVRQVILFGSKARGTGDEHSDIDLLILTSTPVTSGLREKISEALADINLKYDVSLTSIVSSEYDWSQGLIRYMLIHREIERDGCKI